MVVKLLIAIIITLPFLGLAKIRCIFIHIWRHYRTVTSIWNQWLPSTF